MIKQKKFLVAITALLILIGTIAVAYHVGHNQKPFYVGVTYGGNSVQEAKDLIDKVKDYTNLFILQSGRLAASASSTNWLEEIGDYAIASNLNYAIYGSGSTQWLNDDWLIGAKERWGEQFIGIYYNDEPGGDILDKMVVFESVVIEVSPNSYKGFSRLIKNTNGEISFYDFYGFDDNGRFNGTDYTYDLDGKIVTSTSFGDPSKNSTYTTITYYPNGTITAYESIVVTKDDITLEIDNFYVSGNITKYSYPIQPYEQLKQNPIQTHEDVAKAFINKTKESFEQRPYVDNLNRTILKEEAILFFTADYGLYWWDYQGGYDLVLAELGWNNSISQEIGLVRGAANLQNKQWGTIITWKYTHAPYLTDGEEMFEQMRISYETGAQYVLIFNYSEDPENANTLQEEHFQALERFWNDVVQNPKIKHGNIKAEAVLVLPQNYGWGMRNPQDRIWGIWPADDISQQIWDQLQNTTQQHGLKLDIIFEDPDFPVVGKYSNIYYWNQG